MPFEVNLLLWNLNSVQTFNDHSKVNFRYNTFLGAAGVLGDQGENAYETNLVFQDKEGHRCSIVDGDILQIFQDRLNYLHPTANACFYSLHNDPGDSADCLSCP